MQTSKTNQHPPKRHRLQPSWLPREPYTWEKVWLAMVCTLFICVFLILLLSSDALASTFKPGKLLNVDIQVPTMQLATLHVEEEVGMDVNHVKDEIEFITSDDPSPLTKRSGVNYYNGRKETWYSQRVLPGGGLSIPGRHVDSNGLIRDASGYIVVAASDLAKGTILDTSLGIGKVYDCGCAEGTTDIYTNW